MFFADGFIMVDIVILPKILKMETCSKVIVIQNRYKFHPIHLLPLGSVNKNTIFIGPKVKTLYAD
ncbi:hypothetical protein CQ046_13390 [Chryseobacterium sp. MYb7]|nr:hypothetical protein CQ046_13390 [Chryseobacterium sp. MYb7]